MFKPLDLSQCKWLNTAPAPGRDIRRICPDFPTERDAEHERKRRISILEAGRSRSCAELAELLRDAPKWQAADVGCCPLLARRFRIWFVDAALDVHTRTKQRGVPFTYMADDEVDVGQLYTLDWRPLHTLFRKRISRALGVDAIVIGIGKVEHDPSRNKWQPYHYFMVYHRKNWNLFRELRAIPKRTCAQPMATSAFGEPATWFSDMSKLTAFSTVMQQSGGVRQRPLSDRLSREYFGYLASNSPTSFIVCVNCSLAERTVVLDEEEEYFEDPTIELEKRIPGLRRLVP
jgi:hypothetical protein